MEEVGAGAGAGAGGRGRGMSTLLVKQIELFVKAFVCVGNKHELVYIWDH